MFKIDFSRFFDKSPFLTVGNIGINTKAFFVGRGVDERMNELRSSIEFVRSNWQNKTQLIEKYSSNLPITKVYKEYLKKEEWCDVAANYSENANNFSLLKCYDEREGYSQIFRSMNNLLRNVGLGAEQYNAAALIVEFFNIELYNYMKYNQNVAGFDKTIYRSLLVTDRVIEEFQKLEKVPLSERKIGIPLGFMSATESENIAMRFVDYRKEQNIKIEGAVPIVFKIHVYNLDKLLLSDYHSLYPDSIVTSLCSVPLLNLASPAKQEVMLRGAFFQLLRIEKKKDFYEIEAMMSNANRDHLTTNKFKNTNAGKFFGALVGLDKLRKSKDFAVNSLEEQMYKDEIEKAEKRMHDEKLNCERELEKANDESSDSKNIQ